MQSERATSADSLGVSAGKLGDINANVDDNKTPETTATSSTAAANRAHKRKAKKEASAAVVCASPT